MTFTEYRRCPSLLGTSPPHGWKDHGMLRLYGRPQRGRQRKPEKLGAQLPRPHMYGESCQTGLCPPKLHHQTRHHL